MNMKTDQGMMFIFPEMRTSHSGHFTQVSELSLLPFKVLQMNDRGKCLFAPRISVFKAIPYEYVRLRMTSLAT